jgi:hypothetical protein
VARVAAGWGRTVEEAVEEAEVAAEEAAEEEAEEIITTSLVLDSRAAVLLFCFVWPSRTLSFLPLFAFSEIPS